MMWGLAGLLVCGVIVVAGRRHSKHLDELDRRRHSKYLDELDRCIGRGE
jgi:hypothetical protein